VEIVGPTRAARDFAPGFRLRHLMKDLGFCAEAAATVSRSPQMDYPGLALAHRLVGHGVAAGHGDDNIHALARSFLEEETGQPRGPASDVRRIPD
jgi:3-hydroxyisobutyrate dehydrogenase-like beta-hydroxyacid dehydrogenase